MSAQDGMLERAINLYFWSQALLPEQRSALLADEFRAVRREALEEAEKKAEAELASRDAKIIRLSDTITGLRETCDELRRQLSEVRATLGGLVKSLIPGGASDLHGCDPIREGSKETPGWENNPR